MTTDTTAAPAADNPNDAGQESSRQGPGRLIRLGRERARLGVSELAALTKLAPATLEALERDDFTMLSEPVYVRGYYRKCAKSLALSEQELLAAYEKMVAPRAPQTPTKLLLGGSETGSSLKKTRRRAGSPWWLWLIGIALLVAVATWFLREDPNGHRTTQTDAATSAKPLASSAEQPPAAAGAASAEPAAAKPLSINEAATSPAESNPAAPEGQSAVEPPPPPPPPPAPTAAAPAAAATATPPSPAPAGALTLEFKATSWVRIEDSGGKVLLSGVIQSGDRQVLSGKAPYSLFLGNAPGVSVEYQGQAIDLKPYIKSNDTAHLSVPASGG